MKEAYEIVQYRRSEVPRHPIPPMPLHMQRQRILIKFEEEDLAVFREVFGDEDTAAAAMEILYAAPPEIQILALQILHMIEEVE